VPEGGAVYLVGAGPGDPGLLTRRGAEILATADVVVHDRLTDTNLLALAPPGVQCFDVGKQPDDRGDQEAINRLLVAKAKEGLRVVRLKGGDPFVFGRGGEEALALLAGGVRFEVVPGVTSAVAVPAYAGVPVTHRGLATSFTVVAGHRRSVDCGPEAGGTNWEALAAAGGTIVVLMGAAHRARIAERLMTGGLAPATPVLAVSWGTEPRQEVVRTTLDQLGAATLEPPVTMVIGPVAALDLAWRDPGPLAGRKVVVTRAADQASALSQRLRDLGAQVLEVPTIAQVPAADGGTALAASVKRLADGAYSWVVFTSANAVERFFELVPDARIFAGASVAAVGPATARALEPYRVVADMIPTDHRAEGLLARFPGPPPPAGHRRATDSVPPTVLLPQASGAQPELRLGLARLGWQVDAVEAYRTVPRAVSPEMLAAAGQADAICFASSSAVSSYLDQVDIGRQGHGEPRQGPGARGIPATVVCMGPATAATARERGVAVTIEASEHTVDGLVGALVRALPGSEGAGPRD
jgi:uroporphyrinogen III methyltransferase/synthase